MHLSERRSVIFELLDDCSMMRDKNSERGRVNENKAGHRHNVHCCIGLVVMVLWMDGEPMMRECWRRVMIATS